MKRRYLIIVSSVAAFCIAVVLFSLVRIGPHEVGVVTRNVGLGNKGGVIPADYGPGWHFNIPIVHHWIVLPSHIRRVELTKDPRRRSGLGGEALLVQSSDGDRVMLDIDIFFRILPASAHKLVQDSGPGDGHVRVLKALATDRLRAVFGKMNTEQFYDPKARHEKSREALKELLSALKPRFVEVVDIKVLDIEFEPKYERKIKDKKLADQKGELKKAQARAAEQRAIVEKIDIETTKQVKVIETKAEADSARIRAEAEKYATEKRAGADLYRSQLTARGDLAVASAQAKGRQAKTAALSGKGGANLAALEAAGKLKIDSISFPTSGGDWFDVTVPLQASEWGLSIALGAGIVAAGVLLRIVAPGVGGLLDRYALPVQGIVGRGIVGIRRMLQAPAASGPHNVVGLLGIIAILLGMATRSLGAGWLTVGYALFSGGAAAIGCWAWARRLGAKSGKAAFLRRHAAAAIGLAVALIAIGNYISSRHYRRHDLTAEKRFELSPQTEGVLDRLTSPVRITMLFRSGTLKTYVHDLLAEYTARNMLVQLHDLDPDRDPGEVARLKDRLGIPTPQLSSLILEYKGKSRVITRNEILPRTYQ